MNKHGSPTGSRDLIYDVGMHRGEDTDFYLKKGFRVVAFEADPDLVRQCRERFGVALQSNQLVIVEGAIVDDEMAARSGTVGFFRNLDNSVWGTISRDWKTRNDGFGTRSESIEVPAVSFTECLERFGVPYYLKVDIEGADLICVSALQAFRARPSYVSIESEKVSFAALRAEIDLLQRLGYNQFQAVPQTEVPRQEPPNPAREGAYVDHRFERGASGLFGAELAGAWESSKEIVALYRRIFWGYRIFGDQSRFMRTRVGRRLHRWLSQRSGRQIPGWYDTHAKHESVVSE